jgi:U3 small nucleolar RNA-associated protein 22
MSKRKANALSAPPAKKPRPSAADLMSDDGDDGTDLLRRAMEMQNDFEQGSDASEASEDDPDGFEDLEDDVPQVAAPVVALEEPAAKLPLALIVSLVHPSICIDEVLRQAQSVAKGFAAPSRTAKKAAAISSLVDELLSQLRSLPSVAEKAAADAVQSLQKAGVVVPLPAGGPDLSKVQWKLRFETPASVQLDPAWELGGLARHKKADVSFNVDIHVEMPAVSAIVLSWTASLQCQ